MSGKSRTGTSGPDLGDDVSLHLDCSLATLLQASPRVNGIGWDDYTIFLYLHKSYEINHRDSNYILANLLLIREILFRGSGTGMRKK